MVRRPTRTGRKGKITKVHNDGTFDVAYDDGDTESNVPKKRLSLMHTAAEDAVLKQPGKGKGKAQSKKRKQSEMAEDADAGDVAAGNTSDA